MDFKKVDPQQLFDACKWLLEACERILTPKAQSIALFGSFAKRETHESSDIDLLLIDDQAPRKPSDKAKWLNPLAEAWMDHAEANGLPLSLSPLVMTRLGWSKSTGLRLSLCSHALILKDDGFLNLSLTGARQLIAQGDYTQEMLPSGGWLWVPREKSA